LETAEHGTKSDFELLLLQALRSSAFVPASRISPPEGTNEPEIASGICFIIPSVIIRIVSN